MSAVLAVMTIAWLQIKGGMWGWAVMVLISTACALFCGGRFRTFFAAIAVTPPFLFYTIDLCGLIIGQFVWSRLAVELVGVLSACL